MKWLRLYHETLNDPKIRSVAVEAEEPVHAVLAVWMAVLINASENEPRGVVRAWNNRTVGASLDLKAARVEAIYLAMQGVLMDGDSVIAWAKRQFESDDAAVRKRKSRGKNEENDGTGQYHNVTGQSEYVTGQNQDVTGLPLRATDLQITDLKIEDNPDKSVVPPVALTRADRPTDFVDVFDQVLGLKGCPRPSTGRRDAEISEKWLKLGVSPEMVRSWMTENIDRMLARAFVPKCLSLIDQDIINEHHRLSRLARPTNGDSEQTRSASVADIAASAVRIRNERRRAALGIVPGKDDAPVLSAVPS